MRYTVKTLLCLCLLYAAITSCVIAALDVHEQSLKAMITEAKNATAGYIAPGDQKCAMMEVVIKNILAAVSGDRSYLDKANELASELDFEVIKLRDGSKSYIVLRETISQLNKGKNELHGGGVYVFRLAGHQKAQFDRKKPVTIVQAPHIRYESGTQYVARSIFEDTDAFALFMNTAHRYVQKSEDRHVSDLAHNRNTYFHTITKAVCKYFRSALVVQFHGYDTGKYKDVDREISVILSDGSKRLSKGPIFQRIIQRFIGFLGEDAVGIYGANVFRLGGTTNTQGRYIRKYSDDVFIHVEMTGKLRQDFRNREYIRKQFIQAFQ